MFGPLEKNLPWPEKVPMIKEVVIRLWLSALAMTEKYSTDLASSEQFR